MASVVLRLQSSSMADAQICSRWLWEALHASSHQVSTILSAVKCKQTIVLCLDYASSYFWFAYICWKLISLICLWSFFIRMLLLHTSSLLIWGLSLFDPKLCQPTCLNHRLDKLPPNQTEGTNERKWVAYSTGRLYSDWDFSPKSDHNRPMSTRNVYCYFVSTCFPFSNMIFSFFNVVILLLT